MGHYLMDVSLKTSDILGWLGVVCSHFPFVLSDGQIFTNPYLALPTDITILYCRFHAARMNSGCRMLYHSRSNLYFVVPVSSLAICTLLNDFVACRAYLVLGEQSRSFEFLWSQSLSMLISVVHWSSRLCCGSLDYA